MITKNTVVGISIGTIGGVLAFLWVAIGTVQGYMEQVDNNSKSVKQIVLSLELMRINQQIDSLQQERRSLKRQLRDDPNNDLILDQLEDIQDELKALDTLKECVTDPEKEVCK